MLTRHCSHLCKQPVKSSPSPPSVDAPWFLYWYDMYDICQLAHNTSQKKSIFLFMTKNCPTVVSHLVMVVGVCTNDPKDF